MKKVKHYFAFMVPFMFFYIWIWCNQGKIWILRSASFLALCNSLFIIIFY